MKKRACILGGLDTLKKREDQKKTNHPPISLAFLFYNQFYHPHYYVSFPWNCGWLSFQERAKFSTHPDNSEDLMDVYQMYDKVLSTASFPSWV